MIIRIEDIPQEGLEVILSEQMEGARSILAELSEGEVPPPLAGRLMLHRIDGVDALSVSGTVSTNVQLPCDRCLDPVRVPVDERFNVVVEAEARTPADGREEVEVGAQDLDVSYYGPEGLRLLDLIREQILLGLPSSILCRKDCKGICQSCGAELNREPCTCKGQAVDPRFAVLEQLKKH